MIPIFMFNKKPDVWRCKNMQERLQNCRVQLLISGVLSDAENEKVRARIHKMDADGKKRTKNKQ